MVFKRTKSNNSKNKSSNDSDIRNEAENLINLKCPKFFTIGKRSMFGRNPQEININSNNTDQPVNQPDSTLYYSGGGNATSPEPPKEQNNDEILNYTIPPELIKQLVMDILLDNELLIIERILLSDNVMKKFIDTILSYLEDKYDLTPTKQYRDTAAVLKTDLEHLNDQVLDAQLQFKEVQNQTNQYIKNLSQIAAQQLGEIVKNIITKGK